MYEEFITQLCMYAKVIRILSKGYLPISLISPSRLQEVLNAVKEAIQTTNPDYDPVIESFHLYYDMKLVIFGIDRDRNLIVQFPVFIQPFKQQPQILYQKKKYKFPLKIKINRQILTHTCRWIDSALL